MRHKTALTMAASVVGVMLAGSAVLAANMGILSESAELGSLDPLATTTNTTASASAIELTSTIGSTTIPGELVAYQVQGVGVVTLLRNDDVLTVDSVDVGDSWTWESKPDPEHPGGIILVFTSTGQSIEFTAWIEDGQVMVTVEEVADDSVAQDDDGQDDSSEDHEGEEDDD